MSDKSIVNAVVAVLLLAAMAGAQTGEQLAAPPGTAPNSVSEGSNDNGEHTIVVDVWSPTETGQARLSRRFAVAALSAASRIQFTQRRIANSIRMGFPLGEFWIRTDLDAIGDSLRLATLAASNPADQQTLQELQKQTDRLREWCDWLIAQNRNLALANYYISREPLDNDERFQNTVACNRFLLSMLATGRLEEEDRSCR